VDSIPPGSNLTYDDTIVSPSSPSKNQVRNCRTKLGLTQAQLAERAGISRTAVTAIEGERLVPSVAAALALADALGATVESLFGQAATTEPAEIWAWQPRSHSTPRSWRAEVGGRIVNYPASSLPMLTPLPDGSATHSKTAQADETLVLASCDPAAGILASQFQAATGLRMIVLPRSSRQALEMLRDGLVHLAGLHLSTRDEPERNADVVQKMLGDGYPLVRVARWQEGIAVASTARVRSVRAAVSKSFRWVSREPGSGARQCQDRLLGGRPAPRRLARDHLAVVDAVQSGWVDAGICVQLVSEEAGLDFLPVQEEAYDVCFPNRLISDRRVAAFLSVIRSMAYRKLIGELPGYDTQETGELWSPS
jgi:molybdate-binding protein/DNA-binding XRE family transcriptional regulator